MKKKVSLLFAIATIMLLIVSPSTVIKASAATTPTKYSEISKPSDVDALKNQGIGLAYEEVKDTGKYVYTLDLPERGWLILDRNCEGSIYWSYAHHIYTDVNLLSEVGALRLDGQPKFAKQLRYYYYLDPGRYYIEDDSSAISVKSFLYFLPNSKVISHTLTKASDGSSYTDVVNFTPKLGTTICTDIIVPTKEMFNASYWSESFHKISTNANDIYTFTENGEYTIKAEFSDTEWKEFPVMYSFSVYGIKPKADTINDVTVNNDAANNTSTQEEDTETVKAPKTPTIKKIVTNGNKKAEVTWKKVSGVTQYELQYSTNKKFKKDVVTKTYGSSKKSAKISKLKSKKKYFVRMRCYVKSNGVKVYSEWSKTKSVKVK